MIGLTGGIASGKSTVSARLKQLGACVIDADAISRQTILLPEVAAAVRREFGDAVYKKGVLDRAALANAAFASEDGVRRLNQITHPAIMRETLYRARSAESGGGYPLVVIDAPLLIESGLHIYCSSVWLVTANADIRIKRIIERDGATEEQAMARIKSQLSDESKRCYADVIFENNGTPKQLIELVDSAFCAARG